MLNTSSGRRGASRGLYRGTRDGGVQVRRELVGRSCRRLATMMCCARIEGGCKSFVRRRVTCTSSYHI
jgi:hypothetical protein